MEIEEKKIEVTKKDFIKATASMCANDEHARELINGVPIMMMVFPVITSILWDTLVKMKEENENGETE